MIGCFPPAVRFWASRCYLAKGLLLVGLGLSVLGGQATEAQRVRIDAGSGWAFPTNNVQLSPTEEYEAIFTPLDVEGEPIEARADTNSASLPQPVDLKSGRHVYVGLGGVRSIGDNFALGVRLRAHTSELESSVNCRFGSTCGDASGRLWTATVEGRIILTSPDWVDPYLLVGIGVVHTSVDGVTLRNVGEERSRFRVVDPTAERIPFSEVSITDAGGDVGIGASVALGSGLELDGEFRATGSLPGGRSNTVTTLPLTFGLSYNFR